MERERTVFASYREFAPRAELREHVRALFACGPASEAANPPHRRMTRQDVFHLGTSFSPMLADGNTSIVVELGQTVGGDGVWKVTDQPRLHVIGAMTRPGTGTSERVPAMVGVYLRPARSQSITRMPASELTDRIVSPRDVWGAEADDLAAELAELGETDRIERMEAFLLRQLADHCVRRVALDVPGLAALVLRERGGVTVQALADAAGVSRQQLTRVFREVVGVSPKVYCRLARFQSGLAHAVASAPVEWARVAASLGYADQSHMIAEFREFSGLTPERFAAERRFHPFAATDRER